MDKIQYKVFTRKTKYYETDKMGIAHHSNYIRWLEECRMDLLEQIGLNYRKMEEIGLLIPVLAVQCDYQLVTLFDEEIKIIPKIERFTGVKITITYEIRDVATNSLHNKARTEHCFLNSQFKPVRLKQEYPEIYEILKEYEGMDLI